MARKHRNVLGLHTKEEQEEALRFAKQVHKDAKHRILNHDDQGALIYASGYLTAVKDLAKSEGVPGLAAEMDNLIQDLERTYYEVP